MHRLNVKDGGAAERRNRVFNKMKAVVMNMSTGVWNAVELQLSVGNWFREPFYRMYS